MKIATVSRAIVLKKLGEIHYSDRATVSRQLVQFFQ